MNGRRAVIWLRSAQTFEMIFQNRYSGDSKSFAWIIPLPGVPTKVDQPADSFLDELDRLTAPMIEDRSCTIPCNRGWGMDAGIAVPGGTSQGPDVTIWGSGRLGDLEYVTISSSKSKDLMDWLTARGFNLDLSLQAIIDTYLMKGFVFFAAKIAAKVTSVDSVPVVRFSFDRTTTPVVYPVRISAFGRATPLSSVIWVIAADGTYLPANYPTAKVVGSEHTKTSYEAAERKLQAGAGGRTLVIQYAGQPTSDYQREMVYNANGSSTPGDEMKDVLDYTKNLHVVRLAGNLEPSGMTADLELKLTAQPERVTGWFQTPCPGSLVQESCGDGGVDPTNPNNPSDPKEGDGGGCQVAPGATGLSVAVALLVLGLIALGSRRGRRRGAARGRLRGAGLGPR